MKRGRLNLWEVLEASESYERVGSHMHDECHRSHLVSLLLPLYNVHTVHTCRYGHLSVAERAAGAASVTIDPSTSRHVNGALLLCGGEACPSALPAPFGLGEDITREDVTC